MSAEPPAAIPALEGEAADAVAHRGGHVQIIAAAGSGKTEVVSQRVASLLKDGEPPESIVAFTFTEKAAEELKERIRERSVALLGPSATDKLGHLYVGTIHGYCFRLLQTYVPRFETYTPLDPNQLTNLLYREATRLGLRQFDQRNRLFSGIALFQQTVDVVENEYMSFDAIPEGGFKDALVKYYAMLDNYRFMSFGTQIVEAVRALEDPAVHSVVTASLRHLIVDEYQDVNPAQERLIELLAKLARYPIAGCFEDVLPAQDLPGYIELRQRSPLPVVLHHCPLGATYEVLMGAADVYMLGHSRIGEAIHRAGLFAAGDIPFMLQNVGGNITRAMTCQMMAAFPSANFHFFSDCETWSADVVDERPEPTNGFLRVSEGPGLGVTLNRSELERLTALQLPEQPKWIIKSRFENRTRMYNIADPQESIFMVRPDRRRMIPMSYDAPIETEYWDDDGTPEY